MSDFFAQYFCYRPKSWYQDLLAFRRELAFIWSAYGSPLESTLMTFSQDFKRQFPVIFLSALFILNTKWTILEAIAELTPFSE